MSQTYARALVALVLVSVFSVVALAVAIPANTAADAPQPLIVSGTVYDNAGHKVEGISVAVDMKNGGTVVTTKTDTTDGTGMYSVIFLQNEWEIGYTIQVIGTAPNAVQTSNDTVAPDTNQITIDLHFILEIPEFGFDTGVLLAGGAVGFIAVAMLVRKPK